MNNKYTVTRFTILFILIYFIFGNMIMESIFIEDACYYHSHEIPVHINLLFDFPAYEGFHPVATKLGYILFGGIGYLIGKKVVSKRL